LLTEGDLEISGEPDPLLGRTIAQKYAIESVIGRGAMGCVYTARHLTLDSIVAVKVLHGNLATDAAFAERFHREAKSASRLHHPNVIQVIDFGREDDGLFYIAMEYVPGVDLFQLIQREWPINQRRMGELACQILSGVAAAHDIGIIHRDLKPENIIVTRALDDEGRDHDVVKVCDFGIAKIEEPNSALEPQEGDQLTTRGLLLGTPQYMSPEQCRGDALDARSDVYSVGVILYQLLAGRLPFVAPTTVDVVIKQVTEEPVPPTRIYPGASVALEAVCLRALRKLPNDRHATAREMSADIRQALQSSSGAAFADLSLSPTTGRAALPTPPPHAFTAPTLGQPPSMEGIVSARGRSGSRGVRTVAAVVASVLAVGASFVFLRGKSGAARIESAPHSVASVAPPEPLPEREPNLPELPSERAANLPTPDPGRSADKRARPVHRAARTAPSREAQEAPKEEPSREAPVSHVEAAPKPEPAEPIVTEPARPIAPKPPVSSLDPEKGQVSWKVSAVGGGATAGGVVRALTRAANTWTRCYRSGLRSRGKSVEGSGTLRLTCDDQGRVVRTTVSGFAMQDVSACIRESASGVTIPNADTGEAWATVQLKFDVRD
jgi:eukaryotic-like serine/threonine-protein kinase